MMPREAEVRIAPELKARRKLPYTIHQKIGKQEYILDGFETLEAAEAAKADRFSMGMRGLVIKKSGVV